MNKKIMNYAAVGAYALGLFGLNSCLKGKQLVNPVLQGL